MCVAIVMEPGTELSMDEVFKMGRSNADGIGVAWADGEQVHWYKSINYAPQSAAKFIKERSNFFRLVHFRLSTVGGVRVDLCHPFEVGPMASPAQHGHSSKVMIHNGHWNRWKDIIEILEKEDALPDKGPWSDSRLAAYLAHFDEDWLDTVTGRVALMNGAGDIKLMGSWETLRPGIKVSNKHWDHGFNYKRSGRDRDWPGWGWNEQAWEEKEKHELELAKKEEDEKAKKQGNEETGKGEQKEGEIRVGGGPGNSGPVSCGPGAGSASTGHSQLGGPGSGTSYQGYQSQGACHYPVGNDIGKSQGLPTHFWRGEPGKQKEVIETAGRFIANGKVRVEVTAGGVQYDHTPWHNPSNDKWYWIPPESVSGLRYRIEEISPDNARAILESVAAPVHGDGG